MNNDALNDQVIPIEPDLNRYSPQLLINNPRNNEHVLTSVVEELTRCQSFMFIVAFITESGLATLKSYLYDLKLKGVHGRLLTSTYLSFNHPKVFRELLKIKNIEVRLTDLKGFHSKGYIFNHYLDHELIIGSTNLTAQALKLNYEWNVKIKLNSQDSLLHQICDQFEGIWDQANVLTDKWIENYEHTYVQYAAKKIIEEEFAHIIAANKDVNPTSSVDVIVPNKMQQAALHNIDKVRKLNQKKALIVSATGTGKTYLSAFDVNSVSPKRMLFIAHREQILLKAKQDFIGVIGGKDDDYGLLSGTDKFKDAKYLFATIQTISKPEVLTKFEPEAFEYILIDEVHKAGAASYQRVVEYFRPKFMLGMTATPERSDDFNIYQLFDYNVAYEIRLQAALEEDMLCPFHYYGVTDVEIDGNIIDDITVFSSLVTEERVNHIVEKIEYYGYSGNNVKGLIFCSRKEEALQLSSMLNARGYRTVALTGDDSIEHREYQIQSLEEGNIQYIITVDIFNEGIDIPCVNQVVMLRQTQSSIVFIQQLGRGLRKHPDKEFVTIIDFIGNYKNNYLIPIALSGDKSLNKDSIRRNMKDTSYVKGVSTINFEEIAKEQIYKSISDSNLTELKKLKEAFTELKNRIGRRPNLQDFIWHQSIDPVVIVKAHKSYYNFLLKIREENLPVLSEYEQNVLTMLSAEVLEGKRKHEIILIDLLIRQERVAFDDFLEKLTQSSCRTDEQTIHSVHRVLDLSFFVKAQRAKYGELPLCALGEDSFYTFNEHLRRSLDNNEFFRDMVYDLLACATEKAKEYNSAMLLTLYKKYTRKDVCKLLNWEMDESSTVYGYKTKYGTCPIFVTYHKNEEIDTSINYDDEFLSPTIFKWFTRSNRTLESEEVQKIINAKEYSIDIEIFVKKDDDEGSDFYYLGKASPDRRTIHQANMKRNSTEIPVVTMNMVMDSPVEYKLYQYLESTNNK